MQINAIEYAHSVIVGQDVMANSIKNEIFRRGEGYGRAFPMLIKICEEFTIPQNSHTHYVLFHKALEIIKKLNELKESQKPMNIN